MNGYDKKIGVLGAGSWGTALADHLVRRGHEVIVWGIEEDVLRSISFQAENNFYFPGHKLFAPIPTTTSLEDAVKDLDGVIFAVPSTVYRSVAREVVKYLSPGTFVLSAAKGLEEGSLKRLSEVLVEELGTHCPVAVLSGPTFALEVLKGQPTAATVGASELGLAEEVANIIHSGTFRAYASTDLVGIELGGALKNVIALAAGIVDGAGMGANARAALVTRGLAEMTRLIVNMGGELLTASGLSGLGDLLLTTTSDLSRNRRVGLALGQGQSLAEALSEVGQVAEGVNTAEKAQALALRSGVDMPIVEQVNKLLRGESSVEQAVEELLSRARTVE